jgi:hypothetical protein
MNVNSLITTQSKKCKIIFLQFILFSGLLQCAAVDDVAMIWMFMLAPPSDLDFKHYDHKDAGSMYLRNDNSLARDPRE